MSAAELTIRPFSLVGSNGGPAPATDITASLHPDHQRYLMKRGIVDATIAAAGLYTARPCDLARLAGRPVPDATSALVFWYPLPDDESPFCRLRWFPPLRDRDGREVKFSQPPGTAPRLYVPPSVRSVLADPGVPLLLVEGETRGLVCVQHGRPAVAIGGLWSWMQDGRPIRDLDDIAWVDREVMLGGDSDLWARPDLLQAVYALGRELEGRGAKVKVVVLRPAADGIKRGLDELVAAEGPAALDALQTVPLKHKVFTGAKEWWRAWTAKKADAPATPKDDALGIPDVEPWGERIDGADLLEDLVAALRRFVVLPAHADITVALWVLVAHAQAAADVLPILAAVSPLKRCGKTTLLKVLASLVPRPLLASNLTAAAVFRAIEAWTPTLLVDEADTFIAASDELRGVLNSGHDRGTAFVVRVEGEREERGPVKFSTWAPKVMACIGRLPDTLEDRSIIISMRRRAKNERVDRARRKVLLSLADLQRKAARWATDNLEALAACDPPLPDELDDRAQDNWVPLLAVAALAGGPWLDRARQAALALSAARDGEDDGAGVRLLRNLKAVFEQKAAEQLSSADLVAALAGELEWGWSLTQQGLAFLLAPFQIKSKTIRIGDKTPKGYPRKSFIDAWSRYLVPDPQHPQHLNGDADLGPLFDPQQSPCVADGKSSLSHEKQRDVADVADRELPDGGVGQSGPISDAISAGSFMEEI